MDIFIIALLFIMTLILMAAELFLIPGFSIAGLGAIACFAAGNFLTFDLYGILAGTCVLFLSLTITIAMAYWMFHSKRFKRFTLHKTISSTSATDEQLSVSVGDEGFATTRLALIGMANIGGKQVEVKSSGEFLDEGTPIIVVRVNKSLVIVEKK